MSSRRPSEPRLHAPTLHVGVLAGGADALAANVELLERVGVGAVHVDVMDGRFCPVEMGGVEAVKSIETSLVKDVHLMIEDPIEHVADFVAAGAGLVTIHVETPDPAATLQAIPVRRGLALLPATPLEAVVPFIDLIDVLLVLAVTPGLPGIDPSARARLVGARRLVRDRGVLVGYDGGVKPGDVSSLAELGADQIVSGSAIFAGPAPASEVVVAMQAALTA